MTAVGNISCTTVSCTITGGYYAAQIQLAHKMQNTEGMAFKFSADGTCHCNVNYNSHHVNLKAESYDGTDKKLCYSLF